MPLAKISDLNNPAEEVGACIELAKALSTLYDNFIEDAPDNHVREPGVHASEVYPCLRKVVYSLTTPRKPSIRKFWLQRFKAGHALHGMIQTDFHSMAEWAKEKDKLKELSQQLATKLATTLDLVLSFEDEVKIHPGAQALAAFYQIYSSCDGIFTFTDRQTNEVVLRVALEIKTEAADGYERMKEPKVDHVRQAHVYMACLDVPLTWFFYLNKNNQNNTNSTAPFLIIWNPKIWGEIEVRIQAARSFANNNALPERTEGIHCDFCGWRYTCKPSGASVRQTNTTPHRALRGTKP